MPTGKQHDPYRMMEMLHDGKLRDTTMAALIDGLGSDRPIDQEILYRVDGGAELWHGLATSWHNPLGQVYRYFLDPNGACDKLLTMIQSHLGSNDGLPSPSKPLGILVLGCGDGEREYALCDRLIAQGHSLRVALIDVSEQLCIYAHQRFASLNPNRCEVQPLCLDMWDTNRLGQFRTSFFGARPVIGVLIGNTLGNDVDHKDRLADISEALKPNDVLLLEVLTHDPSNAPDQGESSAADDPRASFIVNPVRLLVGGRAATNQLRERVTWSSPQNPEVVTKTYTYWFSREDACTVRYGHGQSQQKKRIREGSFIHLLDIKSMSREHIETILGESLDKVEVQPHTYNIGDGIMLAYACGKRPIEERAAVNSVHTNNDERVITAWRDLSIGICSHNEVYVFFDTLEDNQRIRKKDGRKFAVPHDGRLYRIMEAFAKSSDGQTIRWDDAVVALHQQGALDRVRRDIVTAYGEWPENASEEEQKRWKKQATDKLASLASPSSQWVADVGAELRGKLHALGIRWPKNLQPSIFNSRFKDEKVKAQPRFRFLMADSEGLYCFVRQLDSPLTA